MNSPFRLLGALFTWIGIAVSSADAAVLVEYDFTNSVAGGDLTPTVSGAGVTSSAFGPGAGVTTTGSSVGSPNPRSIFVTADQVDQPISATSPDWLGFSLSANAGGTMNLTSLSFYYAYSYNTMAQPPSAPATFDLRSSVDNYASSISVFTPTATYGSGPVWQSTGSINLTGLAYQGLGTIQFRIFLGDSDNAATNSYLRLDTVVLNGTLAAIPEPSAAGLGLAGLGLGILFRRWNSKKSIK